MSSSRPLWHFAALAGLEAAVRGTLISVMPLVVRETMGSTVGASEAYFLVGIVSLTWGLLVPAVTRVIPRGYTYRLGGLLYVLAAALAYSGSPLLVTLALACNSVATATTFVCFNAYVLDNVDREDLGRVQSLQMLVAAAPWTIGPMAGVWLHGLWPPLPFLIAGAFALAQILVFQMLKLGHGRTIQRAARGANPLAYLGRFLGQPRLITGWAFAVIRSTGWWVYVVYLPYFCIEQGLGPHVGGVALSISNAMLIFAPFILKLARNASVRISVRRAFGLCGVFFLAACLISPWPWGTVGALMAASVLLVTLDVVGGLPFLMSVKPS